MSRAVSIVCLAVAALGLGALLASYNAEAQQRGGPRFEYMLLILDEDDPVALTGEQRIEVQPPGRLPSGRIDDPGIADSEFTRRTIAERHVGVGALNLFGREGWEAIGLMPRDDGAVAVLLKRRVAR
ncbi:MAG: hypothetical protein ACODAQ_07070 [Phycisphaeraceae bacterium]